MNSTENGLKIVEELKKTLSQVNTDEIDDLIAQIQKANKIYVLGSGRSRLMLMAFAMRLMQIGFHVYVVGEIVTPGIQSGDLLIVGSGSGETAGLVLNAKKAKDLGVAVALVTTKPDSSIGRLADLIIRIPTSTEKVDLKSQSIQPGGSTFEQSLLLLGDSIIISLMENMDSNVSVMSLHANLE